MIWLFLRERIRRHLFEREVRHHMGVTFYAAIPPRWAFWRRGWGLRWRKVKYVKAFIRNSAPLRIQGMSDDGRPFDLEGSSPWEVAE